MFQTVSYCVFALDFDGFVIMCCFGWWLLYNQLKRINPQFCWYFHMRFQLSNFFQLILILSAWESQSNRGWSLMFHIVYYSKLSHHDIFSSCHWPAESSSCDTKLDFTFMYVCMQGSSVFWKTQSIVFYLWGRDGPYPLWNRV